jgi:hypothetical protein
MAGRNWIVKITAGAVHIGKSRDRPGCSPQLVSQNAHAKTVSRTVEVAAPEKLELQIEIVCLQIERRTTDDAFNRPRSKRENYDRSTNRSRAPLRFFKRDFSSTRFLKAAIAQAGVFQAVRCRVPENFAALAETWLPVAARVKKPTLPAKKMLSTDCATKNL